MFPRSYNEIVPPSCRKVTRASLLKVSVCGINILRTARVFTQGVLEKVKHIVLCGALIRIKPIVFFSLYR